MNSNFLIFLILILVGPLSAQQITIRDIQTSLPLDLVVISANGVEEVVISDEQGGADLSPFKDERQIQFRLLGYKTLTVSLLSIDDVVFMESTNFALQQVVVSATKWRQNKRDVPGKVLSLSTQEVELKNPQTAADLLGVSGEVFIQKSQQGGGSPMIRGFSANRLLYTIDGVRMNTAIFRSGNLQNVISLDALTIENTEVALGPGSVIYGSDAIGGVMNFRTLSPRFSNSDKTQFGIRPMTRVATANAERTFHLDMNIGMKKLALLTSLTHSKFDNLKMGSHGPDEYLRTFYVKRFDGVDHVITNTNPQVQKGTEYSQLNITQKVHYQPTDNLEFDYGFHYSESSDIPRYDRLIRTRNELPRSAEWYYGPQIWMMHNAGFLSTKKCLPYDDFSVRLAYQEFQESRIDRNLNSEERRIREEKVNAFSVNLDLRKTIGEQLVFFYGFESILNKVESKGTVENVMSDMITTGASRYPLADWWSHGLYSMVHYDPTSKLSIQGGLRYNLFMISADFQNNTAFYPLPFEEVSIENGDLSGSLGLVIKPSSHTTIGLNASTGFRAPNVDDTGKIFDSEPGAVIVPNGDLSAEKVYNAELGIAQIFKDLFRVDVSLYYTHLSNVMVRRDFQLNGLDSIFYDGEMSKVQAIQNGAEATIYGCHLGFELKPIDHWSWAASINFQKGEEELEDGVMGPSRHTAPFFGSSTILYRKDGLLAEWDVQFNGSKSYEDLPAGEQAKAYLYAIDNEGKPHSPSWYTLNFHLKKRIGRDWTIGIGVENITDNRYRTYSSGIAAAGRNLTMSIRAEF
jgi:hemoglobin/transferrin/lactoferrin receptor protein